MTKQCRQATTCDLADFLIEPDSAAWDDFRQHYPHCMECKTEVARWRRLEGLFREVHEEERAHLAADQLTLFQWRAERLSTKDRQTIERHLKTCSSCSEELLSASTFDFSLLSQGEEETTTAARDRKLQETIAPVRQRHATPWWATVYEQATEFFAGMRWLVSQPAFAYALVLILCIPTIRSYSLSPVEIDVTRSPMSPAVGRMPDSSPPIVSQSTAVEISSSADPAAASLALLRQYEAAYAARDITVLNQIWDLTPEMYASLAQMFSENRALRVLIDVQTVQIGETGKEVSVEFRQALLRLSSEGEVYADDKGAYVADIRWQDDTNSWVIKQIRERVS